MKKKGEAFAEAGIERGQIVIRLSIDAIPGAFRGGVDLGTIPEGWEVTDAKAFARDVCLALNDGDDEGTTPIHRLFDAAFNEAIEQGAQGIEETEGGDDDDE